MLTAEQRDALHGIASRVADRALEIARRLDAGEYSGSVRFGDMQEHLIRASDDTLHAKQALNR